MPQDHRTFCDGLNPSPSFGETMNKKLKLDLDSLEVQSFATAGADGERGTVHGLGESIRPSLHVGPCDNTEAGGSCYLASGMVDCEFSAAAQGSCGVDCDSVVTP